MRTMNRFVAFILVFAATLPRAVYGLDLQPRFDPLARRLLDDRVAMGFVVGIVKDGQTAVSAYGETKKSSGITPTGDTVYEIGSITKLFTGILLADMMQRGIVKLDALVQDYLPASVKLSVIDGQPITLQHLVTHTSGLPRLPENLSPVNRFNPYADYTVKRTSPNADMLKRLAPPYDERLWLVENWDLPALAGAGGIRSTVNDMLKFIKANLANDDTPISQAIWLSHRKLYTMENGKGVGMAWNISPNGLILFHDGTTGGYHSWLAVVPSRNVGVVVLANSANNLVTKFGDAVTRIAIGN